MEYRLLLEVACLLVKRETNLVKLIKSGLDVHEATSQNVKQFSGIDIPRKTAKIANFLTLYGGGIGKLSAALGTNTQAATKVRTAIFGAAPEIKTYIEEISRIAQERQYIINWLGRRVQLPNARLSYKAANYHISGGCADVVKVAMNRIDEYLLDKKSRMILTIHDELPIEVHESEIAEVPRVVKEIMESVYKAKYLDLTTGMEYSSKSLGDKIKGFPG